MSRRARLVVAGRAAAVQSSTNWRRQDQTRKTQIQTEHFAAGDRDFPCDLGQERKESRELAQTWVPNPAEHV
jgi:hypothetical protein